MRRPEPDRSRAVLIGVASYGQPGLPHLPAVADSLAGFSAALADPRLCGIPARHQRVLLDPELPHRTGAELHSAADEATDLLVVYLAGHVLPKAPRGAEFALAPGPSVRSRVAGLSLDWIGQALADSPAATRVLVVDCVLAEPDGSPGYPAELLLARCARIAGTSSLVAVARDAAAASRSGWPCTAFTGALLAVVAGGVPTPREFLDLPLLTARTAEVLRVDGRPAPALHVAGPAGAVGSRIGMVRPTRHAAARGPLLALRRSARSTSDRPPAGPAALFRNAALDLPPDPDRERWAAELLTALAARGADRPVDPGDIARRCRAAVLDTARVVGPDHPYALDARHQLGRWTAVAEGPAAAAAVFRRLVDDQRRVLGPADPRTRAGENNLVYWAAR